MYSVAQHSVRERRSVARAVTRRRLVRLSNHSQMYIVVYIYWNGLLLFCVVVANCCRSIIRCNIREGERRLLFFPHTTSLMILRGSPALPRRSHSGSGSPQSPRKSLEERRQFRDASRQEKTEEKLRKYSLLNVRILTLTLTKAFATNRFCRAFTYYAHSI